MFIDPQEIYISLELNLVKPSVDGVQKIAEDVVALEQVPLYTIFKVSFFNTSFLSLPYNIFYRILRHLSIMKRSKVHTEIMPIRSICPYCSAVVRLPEKVCLAPQCGKRMPRVPLMRSISLPAVLVQVCYIAISSTTNTNSASF